jgi:uncharacterized coiled-coil DUF342 family protein
MHIDVLRLRKQIDSINKELKEKDELLYKLVKKINQLEEKISKLKNKRHFHYQLKGLDYSE